MGKLHWGKIRKSSRWLHVDVDRSHSHKKTWRNCEDVLDLENGSWRGSSFEACGFTTIRFIKENKVGCNHISRKLKARPACSAMYGDFCSVIFFLLLVVSCHGRRIFYPSLYLIISWHWKFCFPKREKRKLIYPSFSIKYLKYVEVSFKIDIYIIISIGSFILYYIIFYFIYLVDTWHWHISIIINLRGTFSHLSVGVLYPIECASIFNVSEITKLATSSWTESKGEPRQQGEM